MVNPHERPNKGETDEWVIPKEMIEELGPFDTDPCSPANAPWQNADLCYTKEQDSLNRNWAGAVWVNPPFSKVKDFVIKFIEHRNGIALLAARTDTVWFQEVWKADAIFFKKGRIRFCYPNGTQAKAALPAPVVLVACGPICVERLRTYATKHEGQFFLMPR